ncbi:unnamed protein product [Caenorhabditis auriculariae]|uniref:Uncharacterized protein n=1 Tax=Caenorhabditis auriculariae TaxID=2777116 RepID=A0A8S1HNS1_9PELO|nr:unnamed protein product [Caenorhabditis auriculariae]
MQMAATAPICGWADAKLRRADSFRLFAPSDQAPSVVHLTAHVRPAGQISVVLRLSLVDRIVSSELRNPVDGGCKQFGNDGGGCSICMGRRSTIRLSKEIKWKSDWKLAKMPPTSLLDLLALQHDESTAHALLANFWKSETLLDSSVVETHVVNQPILAATLLLLLLFACFLFAFSIIFVSCRMVGRCGAQRYQAHPTSGKHYAFHLGLFSVSWLLMAAASLYFVMSGASLWNRTAASPRLPKLAANFSTDSHPLTISRRFKRERSSGGVGQLFDDPDYHGDFENVEPPSSPTSPTTLRSIPIKRLKPSTTAPSSSTTLKAQPIEIPARPKAEVEFLQSTNRQNLWEIEEDQISQENNDESVKKLGRLKPGNDVSIPPSPSFFLTNEWQLSDTAKQKKKLHSLSTSSFVPASKVKQLSKMKEKAVLDVEDADLIISSSDPSVDVSENNDYEVSSVDGEPTVVPVSKAEESAEYNEKLDESDTPSPPMLLQSHEIEYDTTSIEDEATSPASTTAISPTTTTFAAPRSTKKIAQTTTFHTTTEVITTQPETTTRALETSTTEASTKTFSTFVTTLTTSTTPSVPVKKPSTSEMMYNETLANVSWQILEPTIRMVTKKMQENKRIFPSEEVDVIDSSWKSIQSKSTKNQYPFRELHTSGIVWISRLALIFTIILISFVVLPSLFFVISGTICYVYSYHPMDRSTLSDKVGQALVVYSVVLLFSIPCLLVYASFALVYTHCHEALCPSVQLQYQHQMGLVENNQQQLIERNVINQEQCRKSLAPVEGLLLSSLLFCLSAMPCVFAMLKLCKYYLRMKTEYYWAMGDNYGINAKKSRDDPTFRRNQLENGIYGSNVYNEEDIYGAYAVYGRI